MTAAITSAWIKGLVQFGASWPFRQTSRTIPRWARGLAEFGTTWHDLRPIIEARAITRQTLVPDVDTLAQAGAGLARAALAIQHVGDAFNPWAAAQLRQDEVRNASVLAAFLAPNRAGDLAPRFLNAFLRRLDGRGQSLPDLATLERGYRVRTEDCPLGLVSERVDITIEGHGFLIGIEVKINAPEGVDQFSRYVRTIKQRADDAGRSSHVIVLARKQVDVPAVIPATWADVTSAARQSVAADPANPVSRMLLAFGVHVSSF